MTVAGGAGEQCAHGQARRWKVKPFANATRGDTDNGHLISETPVHLISFAECDDFEQIRLLA